MVYLDSQGNIHGKNTIGRLVTRKTGEEACRFFVIVHSEWTKMWTKCEVGILSGQKCEDACSLFTNDQPQQRRILIIK